jgi:hypothetical protein
MVESNNDSEEDVEDDLFPNIGYVDVEYGTYFASRTASVLLSSSIVKTERVLKCEADWHGDKHPNLVYQNRTPNAEQKRKGKRDSRGPHTAMPCDLSSHTVLSLAQSSLLYSHGNTHTVVPCTFNSV